MPKDKKRHNRGAMFVGLIEQRLMSGNPNAGSAEGKFDAITGPHSPLPTGASSDDKDKRKRFNPNRPKK